MPLCISGWNMWNWRRFAELFLEFNLKPLWNISTSHARISLYFSILNNICYCMSFYFTHLLFCIFVYLHFLVNLVFCIFVYLHCCWIWYVSKFELHSIFLYLYFWWICIFGEFGMWANIYKHLYIYKLCGKQFEILWFPPSWHIGQQMQFPALTFKVTLPPTNFRLQSSFIFFSYCTLLMRKVFSLKGSSTKNIYFASNHIFWVQMKLLGTEGPKTDLGVRGSKNKTQYLEGLTKQR